MLVEDGVYNEDSGSIQIVQAPERGNIIEKSISKLKETGTV